MPKVKKAETISSPPRVPFQRTSPRKTKGTSTSSSSSSKSTLPPQLPKAIVKAKPGASKPDASKPEAKPKTTANGGSRGKKRSAPDDDDDDWEEEEEVEEKPKRGGKGGRKKKKVEKGTADEVHSFSKTPGALSRAALVATPAYQARLAKEKEDKKLACFTKLREYAKENNQMMDTKNLLESLRI